MLEPESMKIILGITGSLFGWIALRLESFGHRLVRVETKLENGLTEKLNALAENIDSHINGEERRILSYLQTSRELGSVEQRVAAARLVRRGPRDRRKDPETED
jgi:hypothetical protein